MYQSIKELSVINGIPHRTSPVYETIDLESHTITPYFLMDDQPKEGQTSSVSRQSASCHLIEEESTMMEDITLDYEDFNQHAKPREDIL